MSQFAYERTPVIYEGDSPLTNGATFLAIQTETRPPYVWESYLHASREDVPNLGCDMLVISVEQAELLFDFQPGTIADVHSPSRVVEGEFVRRPLEIEAIQ